MTKCKLWTGCKNKKGYGKTWFEGRTEYVHRAAWILANGDIAAGLCVLHKCDTSSCYRLDHLFLGTKADNNLDMQKKGRAGFGGSHLTPDDIRFIRRTAVRGRGHRFQLGKLPRAILAEWFGCSKQNIGFILSGRSWSRVEGR